jgi:hypothetical protein
VKLHETPARVISVLHFCPENEALRVSICREAPFSSCGLQHNTLALGNILQEQQRDVVRHLMHEGEAHQTQDCHLPKGYQYLQICVPLVNIYIDHSTSTSCAIVGFRSSDEHLDLLIRQLPLIPRTNKHAAHGSDRKNLPGAG